MNLLSDPVCFAVTKVLTYIMSSEKSIIEKKANQSAELFFAMNSFIFLTEHVFKFN